MAMKGNLNSRVRVGSGLSGSFEVNAGVHCRDLSLVSLCSSWLRKFSREFNFVNLQKFNFSREFNFANCL